MGELILTVVQIAKVLEKTRRTIYKWEANGKLKDRKASTVEALKNKLDGKGTNQPMNNQIKIKL